MTSPKISVIVPVYKVESYLRKCLDSIVSQTYQNLEIILVDDGSPDNCGAICDEYAVRDERITVLHRENGGLSAARNAGLDIATGEYLGFVDSDDWIEPDMFACLMEEALRHNAEITICGRIEHVHGAERIVHAEKEFVLSGKQALEQLLENRIFFNNVWDKLWKKELFDTVRFPEGRNYEDLAIGYKLFEQARRVVSLPQAKYHYICRAGSILSDISLKNRMDCYRAAKERYDDLKQRSPQLAQKAANQCVSAAISLWSVYRLNPKRDRKYYRDELRVIARFCAQHSASAVGSSSLGITGRSIAALTAHANEVAFLLACAMGYLYRCKHGRFP